ncbi:dinuclear metal center YbgI/SA1388 family protein [Larkinella arboricola]|uniref:GTP cyclohydrolase 1 type 2 homolog n=1 Tax=Larkinella arboricola TaxID=643671 RepID=A0A327WQM8_LARAB|nr:Nif3-like dinuclear metal center hexameric protein [Larkinella arboricola]RAJ94279.1 dinuclear metal center YbgI/SA1388 family protein [Larkinella arboricola]
MKIKDITAYLEAWAPLAYQESYDNAGLIVGDPGVTVTGILVTLDITEAVVEEAVRKNCNLIVAHHPIVFRGLKKLNGRNYVERVVIKAIKNDVALYAAHTNLDNIAGGVSFKIAQKLGLENVRILAPKSEMLMKLVTFVPTEQEKPEFRGASQAVLDALYEAGVGQIGKYDRCSFRTEGTGTFRGNTDSNPTLGEAGQDEQAHENRIEVIFPAYRQNTVLAALRKAHPYEEVAYYLTTLVNENQEVGSGAVGDLPEALSETNFLAYLKNRMDLSVIRHTALRGQPVRRVAVCGGAGGFLLNDALAARADVFITADYKYHEFFDADNRIIIADIGHYESEVFTKELIQQYLLEKMITFAVILSDIDTNPVQYYL